jgi:outer membrane lipoprotein-sorting protein
MYKFLSLLTISIGLLSISPSLQAQIIGTPTRSIVIRPEDSKDSGAESDVNLFKKAILIFYQNSRINNTSEMIFDFNSPGMTGQIVTTANTIAETGGKFNSEITFARPKADSIKYLVISNGKKVWIYRPDKQIYRETTLPKFNRDKYLVGMSAALFSMISERDRRKLIENYDARDSYINTIIKAPQMRDVKGEQIRVDGKNFYAFSIPIPGAYKVKCIVDPKNGELSQMEVTGNTKGMTVNMKEKIKSRNYATTDRQEFIFHPPQGVKRVKSLSIMPFSS